MKGAFRCRKAAGIVLFVLVALAVASAVVMALWNAVLPQLFGWHRLAYFQALGLLVLCRLLFGGLRRGGPGGPFGGPLGSHWGKRRWEAAWQSMTPEEREALCARWKKCGGPPFAGPPFSGPFWGPSSSPPQDRPDPRPDRADPPEAEPPGA